MKPMLRGREVSSRLEMSLRRKPLAKAHAVVYKGLKYVKGDESKIHVVYGKFQISFFVGSAFAAKYTPQGEGLAEEGWTIKPDVFAGICTHFSEALFEAAFRLKLTKESRFSARSWSAGRHLAADFSKHQSTTVIRRSYHKERLVGACSFTHALSSHCLHSREKVLRCAEPGSAWICVLWWQVWFRNVVGSKTVLDN